MATPMTMNERVDHYAELSAQMEGLKAQLDEMKGFFESQAQNDLKDSKEKTIEYYGTGKNKVVVQNADTVKPIAMSVLKKLFGSAYSDFVKEEVKSDLKPNSKKFLADMVSGNYTEGTLSDAINKITADPKVQKALSKKLKGKFTQDKKSLLKFVPDLTEDEASDWAYLITEVMNYQTILQIMDASEFHGSVEDAVAKAKASVIIDETIKVTLEAEE